MPSLLATSPEVNSKHAAPSLVMGNFDAESSWRPAHLATLPSLPNRFEHSVIGVMDELLFLLCEQHGVVITSEPMNPVQMAYLQSIEFSFQNHAIHTTVKQDSSADLDVYSALIHPTMMPLCESYISQLPIVPYAVLPSTESLFHHYGLSSNFPSADIVKAVNSKLYSHDLAKSIHADAPGQAVYSSEEMLLTAKQYIAEHSKIVVKDPYGVSGKGNLVLASDAMVERIFQHLTRQEQAGRKVQLLVEPWLNKHTDFSCQMRIRQDGATVFHSIQVMDNRGLNYGGSFEANESFIHQLESKGYFIAMEQVASELYKEGYFGPVCVDSMNLIDGSIVPIVEINARHSMGYLNDRLNRHISPKGQQGMLVPLELRLPEWAKDSAAYETLLHQLDEAGILLTSDRTEGILPLSANTLLDPRGIHKQGRWYVSIVTTQTESRDIWRQRLLSTLSAIGFEPNHR